MAELTACGGAEYFALLGVLLIARGMDFLSTWVATPNLELEANPIARALGWKTGMIVNAVLCVAIAAWPLPSIMIATTSMLVAARNFQGAWLMRGLGEEEYRRWMSDRVGETCVRTYLFCFGMQRTLILRVGAALIFFSARLIPFAIGWGVVAYGLSVAIFTLWPFWKSRRGWRKAVQPKIPRHEHVLPR